MRNYIAEFAGTFGLIFLGTGAGIIDQQFNGIVTHAGVSAGWGLAVAAMIYCFGHLSGANINPAVSVAFVIAGRFPVRLLPGYVVSQLSGALLASFVLKLLFPENKLLGATMPSGSEMQSFCLEVFLTFFLMFVVMIVAHSGKFAALIIGTVVGLEAYFAGPICGASMNPIRSAAPAIISGHLEHLWIYLTAPFIGAALAIPAWKYIAPALRRG